MQHGAGRRDVRRPPQLSSSGADDRAGHEDYSVGKIRRCQAACRICPHGHAPGMVRVLERTSDKARNQWPGPAVPPVNASADRFPGQRRPVSGAAHDARISPPATRTPVHRERAPEACKSFEIEGFGRACRERTGAAGAAAGRRPPGPPPGPAAVAQPSFKIAGIVKSGPEMKPRAGKGSEFAPARDAPPHMPAALNRDRRHGPGKRFSAADRGASVGSDAPGGIANSRPFTPAERPRPVTPHPVRWTAFGPARAIRAARAPGTPSTSRVLAATVNPTFVARSARAPRTPSPGLRAGRPGPGTSGCGTAACAPPSPAS